MLIIYETNSNLCSINNILKRPQQSSRHHLLLKIIDDNIKNIPQIPITFLYLFYDCECIKKCDYFHDKTNFILDNFSELIK